MTTGWQERDADPAPAAVRFQLVDIPLAGARGGRAGVEEQLARYAAEGWDAVAFDRLSINGPVTVLLRTSGWDRLV